MIPMANFRAILTILIVAMSTFVPRTEAANRAFFVFGDSLVDSGNNNFLATTARADSPPYGIDLPTHRPTGRFSNGFNFPDVVGESMGLNSVLPYLNPELNGEKLLDGANFASAGIGILNDTGYQFVNIITIFRQLQLFAEYQKKVSSLVGQDQAQQLVNNALYLITLGGNDFINNYFLRPFSLRRQQFSIPDYCSYLISEYKKILLTLHDLGARRVLVTGIGPLGCVPGELALYGSRNGECIYEQIQAAHMFTSELFQLTQDLNYQLGADVFVAVNAFDMNMDIINNPQKFGFTTSKLACCGQGPYNGLGICNEFSNLCPNRDVYVFWDAFHPTERALRIIVGRLMIASTKYMKPMNLSSIKALDSKN